MAYATEKQLIDDLVNRPLYVIFAHGNISYINAKQPRFRKTHVPEGMLIHTVTSPGEILLAFPPLINWFLSRPESRLNTFIPLFAIHSISDLYGQSSVYWNFEEVPNKKIKIKDKEFFTYTRSNIEDFKKVGIFRGGESQFESPQRVKGGSETVDLEFRTDDPFSDALGIKFGVYEFTVDDQINYLEFGDEFTLSDVLVKIPKNALVSILSCSAWQLRFEGSYTGVLPISPIELNAPKTGPLTRRLLRKAEALYAENETDYHTLPLITKDSPAFQTLLEKCSPIYLPNLLTRENGKFETPVIGALDPISNRNWENALKEGGSRRRRMRQQKTRRRRAV